MARRERIRLGPGARLLVAGLFYVALAGVPTPGAAQDVAGRWAVRWAQGIRSSGGELLLVQRWGDAELVLSQDGEAVRGTWTTDVRERVTWTVEGTASGDRLRLASLTHDSDNDELAIVESIEWRATVTPDGLEGEVALAIRGRPGPPTWRPFRAVRDPG